MKNIVSYVPQFVINLTIFIFGIILLLHTLGFFKTGLDKAIILIAIIMIIYGFIEIGGLQAVKKLFGSKETTRENHPTNSHDDNDKTT